MKTISKEDKSRVIYYLMKNKSTRYIQEKVGVGRSTVQRIKEDQDITAIPNKGGRPSKLTSNQKKRCAYLVTKGGLDNAVHVQKSMRDTEGLDVSAKTVRRALHEQGLGAIEKVEKPKLTTLQKRKRLQWAKKYKHYTVADWRRVVWSDETKINRFNSDGRVWSWIRDGQALEERHIKQTVKHGGGNVMVWSCISAAGVGWLCKIEPPMDQHLYLEILKDELQKSMEHAANECQMELNQMVFQHDNDPKHTAKTVQQYLQGVPYETMDWPS